MITIDFKLNRRYTPVEEAAFRLVGLGCTSLGEMVDILYLFSEEIIAKAIEHLVNDQLLSIDLSSGSLSYTPLVEKLFHSCSQQATIVFPEEVKGGEFVVNHPLLVSQVLEELDKEDDSLKQLSRSITFILRRGLHEENGSL